MVHGRPNVEVFFLFLLSFPFFRPRSPHFSHPSGPPVQSYKAMPSRYSRNFVQVTIFFGSNQQLLIGYLALLRSDPWRWLGGIVRDDTGDSKQG